MLKMSWKEDVKMKFLKMMKTLETSEKYLHSFNDGLLIDVMMTLFEFITKNNMIIVIECIHQFILHLFQQANKDCINKQENNPQVTILRNDTLIILNEMCNSINNNKNVMFKNHKQVFSLQFMSIIIKENVADDKAAGIGYLHTVADGVADSHFLKRDSIDVGKSDQLTLEKPGTVSIIQAVHRLVCRIEPHFVAVAVPDAADDLDVFVAPSARKMLVFNERATRHRRRNELRPR